MKPLYSLFFLFLMAQSIAVNANDSSAIQKPSKNHSNIVVTTTDGIYLIARLKKVTDTYFILDAAPYNEVVKLNAFYMRRVGAYYKIDLSHVRCVIVKTKEKLGRSTVEGAISGMTGALSAEVLSNPGTVSSVGNLLVAGAALSGIGATGGFLHGLFSRKKSVVISGNYDDLKEILHLKN